MIFFFYYCNIRLEDFLELLKTKKINLKWKFENFFLNYKIYNYIIYFKIVLYYYYF